jgi:hypothetical protein
VKLTPKTDSIKYGTRLATSLFTISNLPAGAVPTYEYAQFGTSSWSILPAEGLIVAPAVWSVRIRYTDPVLNAELATVPASIACGPAEYSSDLVPRTIDLGTVEHGRIGSDPAAVAQMYAEKLANPYGTIAITSTSALVADRKNEISAVFTPIYSGLYSDIALTLILNVVSQRDDIEFGEGSTLSKENGLITGLSPESTVASFLAQLDNYGAAAFEAGIGIEAPDGTDISKNPSALLGTGTKIRIGSREYKVVVPGDINGDGKVTLGDADTIFTQLAEDGLKNEARLAADVNSDGRIDALDLIAAILVSQGKAKIENGVVTPISAELESSKEEE